MQFFQAFLFLAIAAAAAFTWGYRFRRRRPSLAGIMALRDAIAAAMPPQVIGQFTPEQFNRHLEEQLQTYLQYGGDLTPPKPFVRATRRVFVETPEDDLHELAIDAGRDRAPS